MKAVHVDSLGTGAIVTEAVAYCASASSITYCRHLKSSISIEHAHAILDSRTPSQCPPYSLAVPPHHAPAASFNPRSLNLEAPPMTAPSDRLLSHQQ